MALLSPSSPSTQSWEAKIAATFALSYGIPALIIAYSIFSAEFFPSSPEEREANYGRSVGIGMFGIPLAIACIALSLLIATILAALHRTPVTLALSFLTVAAVATALLLGFSFESYMLVAALNVAALSKAVRDRFTNLIAGHNLP